MVGLRTTIFAFTLVLMAGGALASPSEIPFGENKKLGISFQVEGGQDWCGSKVTVSLNAKKSKVLTENSEEFQHMLGRIRAIIEGYCPEAGTISFLGNAGGTEVSVGESARFTNWMYVPHKIGGKQASCAGPDDVALCAQRWSVFFKAREIFSRPGFEKVLLTRYLSTDAGADVEFTAGSASGRVSFISSETGIPFKSSAEFVEYQMNKLRDRCAGDFASDELEMLDPSSSMQGASCSTVSTRQRTYFLIRQTTNGFEVTGFSDFTPDGNTARELAVRFAAAVRGEPASKAGWAKLKSDTFDNIEYPTPEKSPCAEEIERYLGLESKAVAIRLWPDGERGSETLTLGVFIGKPAQLEPDRWRMRVKLRPFERDSLWIGAVQGSWLVFKILEHGNQKSFQNQLFVARSSSTCAPLRGANRVSVASMPKRAVQLFAEGLGIKAEAGSSDKELRASLEQWSLSGIDQ